MEMKVVGVQFGVSSKGNPYTIVHVVHDFDDYMKQKGAVGEKAENLYITGTHQVAVGDVIVPSYGVGFGGKAIVTGLTKKSVGNK